MCIKELNIILLILLFIAAEGYSQSKVLELDTGIIWHHPQVTEDVKGIRIGIDTLTGDTLKIVTETYVRITKFGDTVETLKFDKCLWSSKCSDDGYDFSGRYKEFYKSGQLKRIGSLVCNKKKGEWISYYQDGNIAKYENYESYELSLGHKIPYQSGIYKEFYPNGQLKISGMYRVVQKWTAVLSVDTELYEIKRECCDWVTTSIKCGTWREFDTEGHLIQKADYQLNIEESSIYRDIPDIILENKN